MDTTAGDRVQFTAKRGHRQVTLHGTVVPSRYTRFSVVELDTGPIVEVNNDNLSPEQERS